VSYVPDITERHFEEEPERCAVASCNRTNPGLYDDNLDQYYCDDECLAMYIAEHPEEIAEFYKRLNIHPTE
jgi:hypothetical protein